MKWYNIVLEYILHICLVQSYRWEHTHKRSAHCMFCFHGIALVCASAQTLHTKVSQKQQQRKTQRRHFVSSALLTFWDLLRCHKILQLLTTELWYKFVAWKWFSEYTRLLRLLRQYPETIMACIWTAISNCVQSGVSNFTQMFSIMLEKNIVSNCMWPFYDRFAPVHVFPREF